MTAWASSTSSRYLQVFIFHLQVAFVQLKTPVASSLLLHSPAHEYRADRGSRQEGRGGAGVQGRRGQTGHVRRAFQWQQEEVRGK